MRRHDDQIRAGLLGLPIRHSCLHSRALGRVGSRQHDAVAILRAAAHGDLLPAQRRILIDFRRGVKAIKIGMKDNPSHDSCLPSASFSRRLRIDGIEYSIKN